MISKELFLMYKINPDDDIFANDEVQKYKAFLQQTDYVANKIAEALYLKIELDEDYTEILQARQYAREQINALQGEQEERTV